MKKLIRPVVYIAVALLIAYLSVTNPLLGVDASITDRLYSKLTGIDDKFAIVCIDEETLTEYGKFETWSREKTADLLERLWTDEGYEPEMVILDIMFFGYGSDTGITDTDKRLADAASLGDTVVASQVVFRGKVKQDADIGYYYDSRNIEYVDEPFGELKAATYQGFVNPCVSTDGYVRNAMYEAGNGSYKSLSYTAYELHCKKNGLTPVEPSTDTLGQFRFFFSGEPAECSHYSLAEVLKGNVTGRHFKDKIVLVGAYAPGMQDDYPVSVVRGEDMYGVEIHANIIQALMGGKTAVKAPYIPVFAVIFLLTAGFLFAASRQKLVPVILESVVLGGIYLFVARTLAFKGYIVTVLYFLVFLVLTDAYFVVEKYFFEKWRRKRTLEVFKKYVAPQVVEDISKSGEFVLKLGGERREVAVLFVDIRGFTPLSESMQPEQVVAILNEYLALTTASILGHRGTLDKFIGDATMAVFNAPFDQEDYIYEAVCAAWDIKQGSRELGERLYREFGKQVGFGVGVNCGPAVVGNIGCEFRMDYTAIGDTVNTAARLEANAKAEEILISEYVYEALKDRIITEEVGEIPLKGKSTKLMVYRVLDIHKDEAEDNGSKVVS